MGSLEREWISIKSELTVGIPMGLNHLKLVQKIQTKNLTIENAKRLSDTANQLTKEVVGLQNQVRKVETKLLAVLDEDVAPKTEEDVNIVTDVKEIDPINKLNNTDNNKNNNSNIDNIKNKNKINDDYDFQIAKEMKFQKSLSDWKLHLAQLRRRLECKSESDVTN